MRTKLIVVAAIAALFLSILIPSSALAAPQPGQAADLDQWSNNAPGSWENGNLNPSKSHYREDYVVPYRAKLTGLIAGDSYSLPIEWDTTKGGLHAEDFLQTYNVTETADPCAGGACPAGSPTTFPIPIDVNVNNATGLHPTLSYLATDPRFQFTMWGGTITGASTPVVSSGSFSGGVYSTDSSTSIVITFTAGTAFTTDGEPTSAVLAWGGHISTHSDWGVGNTAVNISGSAYHMRLGSALNSDFTDNTALNSKTLGQQDRSLQLATDAYSSRITIEKVGDPVDANALFTFTMTQPDGSSCDTPFVLAALGLHESKQVCNLINADGSFTITEHLDQPGNYLWGLTSIQCTSIGDPAIDSFTLNPLPPVNASDSGSVTFSLTTALQQDATCIFTNSKKPTVELSKVVHNEFGGTMPPGDFGFHVFGTNMFNFDDGSPLTSADTLRSGDKVVIDGGSSFYVTEDSTHGYEIESQEGCSGTADFKEEKTCTFTNHDIQPTLTVIKHVINNSGGSALASDFTMSVEGTNVSATSFAGNEAGVQVTLNQGAFNVTESNPGDGYLATYENCTGQINVGDSVTCTITNDDIGPKLRIVKNTIGGDGTFPINMSWPSGTASPVIITNGGTGDTGYIEVGTGTTSVTEVLTANEAPGWDFTGVSCQEDGGASIPVAQSASITLSGLVLAHNYTCTFTNTRRALLTVHKETDPADDPTVFGIDLSGSGTITGDSAASISTSSPYSYEVTAGTYSVEETVPDGWDLTTNGCLDISVVPGDSVDCTITNTKRGHLIVHKTTDPADDPTIFDVTASGSFPIPAGAAGSISTSSPYDYEVRPGTYSVDETVPAGWDLTDNACVDIAVGAGETVDCTITNTKRGHLIVHKTTDPADDPTIFDVTASGSFPIPAGAAGSISTSSPYDYEVRPGTYSVDETIPAGWDLTDNGCVDIAVGAGEEVHCTITNTKRGHLIVTKVTDPASDTDTEFPVLATGSGSITAPADRTLVGNGGSADYEVAGNGTYTVTETVPENWAQTDTTCDDVFVGAGQEVHCEIHNSAYGHVIVIKHVVNDNGGTEVASSFTMQMSGNQPTLTSFPGSEDGIQVDLLAGDYSVSETGPSGYAATYSTDCSGTIAAGETKTCTVTNDDIQPKLIVTKVVINDNGGTANPSSFTMNVAGNLASPSSFPGGAGTIVGLNAGAYSVTESDQSGYEASFSADCSGTINIGEEKTCTVTNDDIQPLLIVVKQVINNDGRTNTPSDFTMNVMSNNLSVASFPGGAGTPVGLDAGIYAVTESGPVGYQGTFSADCSGTIAVGETRTCVVTNNDLPFGVITSSELCKFDVDPSTAQEEFLLNFQQRGQAWGLISSNPGQFYYNVLADASGTVTMEIPSQFFVLSGATPIHAYTSFTWTEDANGNGCFVPGSGASGISWTSQPDYPVAGVTTYTVTGVPAGAYVNAHLDYKWKKTNGWDKDNPNTNDATGNGVTIEDGQKYTFGDGTHNQDTYSKNRFN